MKKLLAMALIIFPSFGIFAQSTGYQSNPHSGKFTAGIMLSPSIAWSRASVDDPNVNSITNGGAKPGIAFGLLVDYFFANNYGIEYYLRYSGFDDNFKYYANNNSKVWIDRTLHMQYFELPVTFKMRTNEVGYMKYFAQLGIMPGVKLAAKADITSSDTLAHTGTGLNITATNDVNLFMLYSVVGLGAEYNLGGSTNLVGSITWNNGFTNLWAKAVDNKTVTPPVYSNFNSQLSNITLNVGFFF